MAGPARQDESNEILAKKDAIKSQAGLKVNIDTLFIDIYIGYVEPLPLVVGCILRNLGPQLSTPGMRDTPPVSN